jgi:hypothetical protein
MMLATGFGDLPSIDHSGQLDVGDEHVGGLPLAPCQRLFPVVGVNHVVAFLPQRFDDEFADKGGRPQRQVCARAVLSST